MNSNLPSWSVMGNIEVNNLMDNLNLMIRGEGRDGKIFKEHPHYNFDNYFSEGKVSYSLGR